MRITEETILCHLSIVIGVLRKYHLQLTNDIVMNKMGLSFSFLFQQGKPQQIQLTRK